jgi:uncharacterized membrane protein SpoIIM required for sporulation
LREGLFIKKNKDRWQKLQEGEVTDADEIARNFTQLVDDLAYAKTFYPSSRVTQYINSLASRIFLGIYKNRKEESNRLLKFWKYDVPDAMYRHRYVVLFSFFVFSIFFAVGFFSAKDDPSFIREILGESYVNETEKNISEGNPFGIYGEENSLFMFVRIMLNNILVAFTSFFKGLFFGVPSMMILMKNSIMVGVFEQMFFAKGLGQQAVVTILLHGLLELTAIIIACAAGLVMGKSMLFPGTLKRMDAFRNGVKDGVKMVVGLVPVFIVAAWIESYITRHYKMPVAYSLAILAATGIFVLWYFVIYPIRINQKKKAEGL